MEFHRSSRARSRKIVFVISVTAALATLAACSSPGGTTTSSTKQHPAATGSAAVPAASPTASSPAAAAATSGLTGTWRGQYSGTYQGTFVLHWRQSGDGLNGRIHISSPATTLPIHGRVTAGSIKFGTVGSYAITYSGSVSGSSMSGSYKVNTGGGAGGPWTASKA